MSIAITRLKMPGFAFWAMLLLFVLPCAAQSLKPAHTYEVAVPKEDGMVNAGPQGFTYTRSGQLAYWYTEQSAGELVKRDQIQPSDPWRMKLQLVDTATGEIKNVEWPTRRIASDLQLQANGNLVALTGPLIRCLSGDLKELGRIEIKDLPNRNDFRFLSPSPGGRVAWMVEATKDSIILTRIDAAGCKPSWSVEQPRQLTSYSANDNMIIATNGPKLGGWTPDTGWKTLVHLDDCCVNNAQFVNQNLIMAYHDDRQGKRSLLLLNGEGKQLLEESLDKGYDTGPIIASNDGKFAAAVIPKGGWSRGTLYIAAERAKLKILIFNLATMKTVGTIENITADPAHFQLAMAPGGKELAVLAGSKVFIYELGN